jgi:hypothetical protein
MSSATLHVIPAHAGIHPLPVSTVLDPGPVSSTGWHFRRDDSCLPIEGLRQRLAQIPFLLSRR